MSEFPVETFKDAAPHLRRPFAANAVRWKLQTQNMVVGYVDARTVIERLNLVVPHLWEARYEPWGERVDTNLLVCHLTIDGLTRSDIGKGSRQETQKGAYSDALKRAAVHFGVGVSLYTLSRIYLDATPDGREKSDGTPTLKPKGKSAEITPKVDRWLREKYEGWLKTDRGKHFGDALDHGDSPDAIGDPVEAVADEPAPAEDDNALVARRQELEKLYEEKVKPSTAARRKLPVGKFQAQLKAAQNGELDELAAKIEEVAG